MKSEFLGVVSHELRTPLVSVLGTADLLLEQPDGPLPPRTLRYVESIAAGGRRLLELVNHTIDIARLDAGGVEVDPTPCSLLDVGHATVSAFQQAARAKHGAVSLSIDPPAVSIQSDGRLLIKVLHCLMSNAVKFTPSGGRTGIEIAGDGPARAVRITVWDTGTGIAPEKVGLLFRPFAQLDGHLQRSFEGTGLGLALVDRLTRLLGASLSVESEVGKGSRFTVTFPWQPKEAAPGGPSVPEGRDAAAGEASSRATALLGNVPPGLREALAAAVRRADLDLITASVDALSESDPEAAVVVQELLDRFEYDRLLGLVKERAPVEPTGD